MELLEEDLTCPVCCCLFEDPRVLPCSHSFCRKCLEGMADGNRSPVRRAPLKCPTCRKETAHNGASGLPVNYSLRSIAEKYGEIRALPKTTPCRAHGGQPLNIFCATDLTLICGFCATAGDHRGHEFCALEEAHQREKAALDELLCRAESWSSAEVLASLDALEAARKTALQSVTRDAERVTDYFDGLLRALQHKRGEILSDFDTLKLTVMQTFDPEIERLRAVLDEQRSALAMAESFGALTEPLAFLQQMQIFRQKLRVIRDTPLPSRTDVDAGVPLVPSFDVKEWDRVRLGNVDTLRAPHDTGSLRPSVLRAVPRFYRAVWRFIVPLCVCLFVMSLLPADCYVSSLSDAAAAALGDVSLTEVLRWLGACWKRAEGACTHLTELCRNCITELIDAASDFIS